MSYIVACVVDVLAILISLRKKTDGKNDVVLYNTVKQITHKSY